MTEAMVDRLLINEKRLSSMINGLKKIKSIPDTLVPKINKSVQPSGITVEQMRVPIGVIGMIYESRPNVTIDAAGLSIKSGNSIILRGGSEAINTNMALSRIINQSIRNCDMPTSMVQLIQTIDRTAVRKGYLNNFVDVIIPRGGKADKKISSESKIPVIKHLWQLPCVYIDREADFKTAMNCIIRKHKDMVCNAAESLLIHKSFPKQSVLKILVALSERNVQIRGCKKTKSIFKETISAKELD